MHYFINLIALIQGQPLLAFIIDFAEWRGVVPVTQG
jgi:hypothetical protein